MSEETILVDIGNDTIVVDILDSDAEILVDIEDYAIIDVEVQAVGVPGDNGWPVKIKRQTVGGNVVLDYYDGGYYVLTLTADTHISIQGWPQEADLLARLTIALRNSGGYIVTWDAAVLWAIEIVPNIPVGRSTFVMVTDDNGATIEGNLVGTNYTPLA